MKRIVSLLLALVMVIGLIPMAAFAADHTTISFETTFTEDMTVGDTFTVTANLANNVNFLTMTLSLEWNEDVLKFTGFDKDRRGALVTEVYTYTAAVANHELGIVTGSDPYGYDTNGKIFTANFEIIGSGALDIGLKDADATEFEMLDENYDDINPIIDFSAIENLAVPGAEPDGPVIPDGAPFTAVTTDAGSAVAVEDCGVLAVDPWGGMPVEVPYYHITIPAGATEAYVRFDMAGSDFMSQTAMDGTPEIGSAWACVNDYESGMAGLLFDDQGSYTNVIIPLEFNGDPWGGEDMKSTLKTSDEDELYYAVGPQDADANTIAIFSLEYDSEDGEDTYAITINQPTGGTVSAQNDSGETVTKAAAGDFIFLANEPEEGYQFKHYLINGVAVTEAELGMANGFYTMPGEDITISAVFEAIHTCAYDQENVADKYLKSEATCQSGAVYYKSCTCGEFATTAETFVFGETVDHVYVDDVCKWCGEAAEVEPEPEEPVVTPGYRFATSADVSTEKDDTAVVRVKVTGHSDENVTTYNAYDLTLTFDTEKLEYVSCAGAVVTDGGEVKVEGNTIRIVGCGAAKEFGTEIAALTFKTKTEGSANVTIDKVQVSDQEDAVTQDIPEATAKHDENDTTADTTPDESVIVVPFSVTKPDFVSGNDKVVAGDDYTFSFTDTDNYTYSELKVTVGGAEVTPSEADGVYTFENVTGAIVIEVTKTANSYNVIKPENVTGPDKATYGTDYVFTVTPDEGKEIDSVKATIGGEGIAVTKNTEGNYVIAGGNISGEITITVIQKDVEVPETKYTNISFSGITEAEIEGGLTQKAEAGKDFTFKLVKIEGVTYTLKIGEEVLTANEDGSYTIPAAKMIEGNLTVTIEKAENINVDVTEYIKLDGQSMFLITAKSAVEGSASVLKYGDDVMYTSAKYNAYSWLVISAESAEAVKAAAETAITIAEPGSIAPAVAYGYDVNGTSKVDVNDAQLVYDMYNASYDAFTENLTVKKFLEADTDGSTNLGTQDVATIINYIVNQNA